eukprot:SAG31_NODE_29031_length_402_cov_0.504950_1_plen_39_part_10
MDRRKAVTLLLIMMQLLQSASRGVLGCECIADEERGVDY